MIKLSEIPTRAPEEFDKHETKEKLDEITEEIADYQHILYAEQKHSLLVILQGMDASGKDGATRNVFRYCSPTGVWAYGFKKPTEEELEHDFLWRVHRHVPRKGMIQIFNRSHYEDVLIQRVHKWIDEERVEMRIRAINAFENLLVNDNQTTILKFYMHLSPERQQEKLQERIDEPRKQWKHNPNDWEEAKLWKEYRRCYEDVINRSVIPWIIVPVDQRWYRNYFIATRVLETLKSLDMQLPLISQSGKQ
jgi:PPK2 family polyphosphate:nucleotide phosphotransferase